MKPEGIIVSITGASGVIYGVRLTEELLKQGFLVYLIVSKWARRIMKAELGINIDTECNRILKKFFGNKKNLKIMDDNDLAAPVASGSHGIRKMVVIPCSMGTLARIASGISFTLTERAADVILKENGLLVLVPRETPLNAVHIENMLRLSRAGAHILPAMPAFYHKPKNINDMVDFIIGKVLDLLDIEHRLFKRW